MTEEGGVRIHVVLSAELVRQIDQLVGKRKRGAFIKDAVGERLKRERLRKALESTAGALRGKLPPGWETPEKTRKWVRTIRAASDARLKRIWGTVERPSS